MAYLVLVRHGQSQWNLENRFTGWVDVPLSAKGEKEAHGAGKRIKGMGIRFDVAYTSVLVRASSTLEIILKEIGQPKLSIDRNKALNERMYGDLQGMDKDEARAKFGAAQVLLWRRSYDIAPPGGESLKDTAARTLPYYKKHIAVDLKEGKNVLVSAHGNSLRSIVMQLDKLTPKEVVALEIPTGVPYVYEFDKKMKILSKTILQP